MPAQPAQPAMPAQQYRGQHSSPRAESGLFTRLHLTRNSLNSEVPGTLEIFSLKNQNKYFDKNHFYIGFENSFNSVALLIIHKWCRNKFYENASSSLDFWMFNQYCVIFCTYYWTLCIIVLNVKIWISFNLFNFSFKIKYLTKLEKTKTTNLVVAYLLL